MVAIQNAVRRFFSIQAMLTVKHALLRICRKQGQPVQVSEPTVETAPEVEICVAEDDTEERFAAWEDSRAEKLQQAESHEQQGLRLLEKAALLRAAVHCDDRGETFIAQELRDQADGIGSESFTDVPADTISESPRLRIVTGDEVPVQGGA
jgi:hypothetical protein